MTRDDTSRPRPAPLTPSAPLSLLQPRSNVRAVFNGQSAAASWHLFVNQTSAHVELYWFHDTQAVKHGTIAPNSNLYVGTYSFHNWKVVSPGGSTIGKYAGDSATITIEPDGGLHVQRNAATPPECGAPSGSAGSSTGTHCGACADSAGHTSAATQERHPVFGVYRRRGDVLGMPICAFDCVGDEAVSRVAHVAAMMLAQSPGWLLSRLRAAGSVLAIVGREQNVTDLPPHRFMKHLQGRDLDATSRGLGGTQAVPVTSVGEENVTMVEDPLYPYQSVFVHELGHAVLNLGLHRRFHEALCDAFEHARQQRLYPSDCYQMTNEQEYWAVATEAWFESTIRTDVNGGLNSREKLRQADPRLASLLEDIYGDGSWRYTHDCPAPLRMRTHRDGPEERRQQRRRRRAGAAGAAGASSSSAEAAAASALHQQRRRPSSDSSRNDNGALDGEPQQAQRRTRTDCDCEAGAPPTRRRRTSDSPGSEEGAAP